MQDISTFVNLIKKQLSIFDIFLLGFIASPFVFQAWTGVMKEVGFLPYQIGCGLVIIAVLYIIFIAFMIRSTNNSRRQELARDQIIGYLQSKDYKMMSFDRVREKINNGYDDKFITSIIAAFPSVLRRATLKGGKLGVARLLVEAEEGQEI